MTKTKEYRYQLALWGQEVNQFAIMTRRQASKRNEDLSPGWEWEEVEEYNNEED